jgi:hypothetical protein
MTKRGSPRTMHSHICHSEGKNVAKALSGLTGGSDART